MVGKENKACDYFKDEVYRFLENNKDPLYKTVIQRMLAAYEAQECKMSFKVHFLQFHIEHFPENLITYSENQAERFQQDVSYIERGYQERWNANKLADLCCDGGRWMSFLDSAP